MRRIEVISPGPLTVMQDAGRVGYAHLGVPRSGAFDERSWKLANRLVGNRQSAAALEALGGGLELQVQQRLTMAVTGAQGDVLVDGRVHGTNMPIHASAGAHIRLGPPRHAIRYYLAVSGGFDVRAVLGSRSYDTLGRIGPPPLAAGQVLEVGEPSAYPHVDHAPVTQDREAFDISPGPDATSTLLDLLLAQHWDLDPQSNRIGVRLRGRPLPVPPSSLPSKPMVLGAVQIPPNGLPIILGPDHPTTGGYPVVAVVSRKSMNDVAQWSSGTRRFSHHR